MNIPKENSTISRNKKQKVISERILKFLLKNIDQSVPTIKLVHEVYGNEINLKSKKRCIYEFFRRDVKPELLNNGFEVSFIRNVGIKVYKSS